MGKLKILVADDDKLTLDIYARCLLDELYEKKFVGDGEAALKEYEAWNPDVVVLDIMMPIMSGYFALKAIREQEKGKPNPVTVIMSTALAGKNDIMDCAKLGIQGYIVKPIRPAEIAGKIEACHRSANPERP